ncbi:hypothetical protein HHI36_023155 [Cryptolaemus montrouzieri]|uniref:Protein kinase domain-containing protein n=1 Tax=Cryptolaemus montrouzieri TaxID=559131 RepID=A0ABD2PH54_9CUCU
MRPVDIKSKSFDITNKLLGSGAFSHVKVAYLKGDKKPIALKICSCNSEAEWLQSLNEICLLKKLAHENVASIKKYEITRYDVLIGLDKGDASLKQFIVEQTDLMNYAIPIMSQLINGLNFIHRFKIVHGDIKPSNIIYMLHQNKIHIQIVDFGLSHVAGRSNGPVREGDAGGTKTYLAPERLSHSNYDESSDLFSAGIVFFEILFKKHPFFKEGHNYTEIMKSKPDPKFPLGYQSLVPKDWLILLCSMLSYNPGNRNEVRNNKLLETKFIENVSIDHQTLAVQNISNVEAAEQCGNYSEAALFLMEVCINLEIACHETDNNNLITEFNARISSYRKKVLSLLHLSKNSFSQHDSLGGTGVHDEYYDYLMEVTASTPNLKHYIEIGYTGELYLKECKGDIAFRSFMDALQYLNTTMPSEPPGDRKTIIGKKMLQWTNIAETLKTNS